LALAVKGVYFIVHMDKFERLVGSIGHFNTIAAWFVIFAHGIGGLCMAVGIATRLSALLNIVVMLGAIVFVHSAEGLFGANGELQFSIFVMFTLGLIMWKGAGNFSVNTLLNAKKA